MCVCERWIKAPKLRCMTASCMKMDCPSPHVISILRHARKKLRPFTSQRLGSTPFAFSDPCGLHKYIYALVRTL